MDIDLDSSRRFRDKVLLISGILAIATPIFLFLYFSFGESKFVYNKTYYAITVDEGKEMANRLDVMKKPLTDSENIKSWLNVGMIDIYSTDALNYQSEERWQKVENLFASNIASDFWNAEMERYELLLSESFELSYAVISEPPSLIGEAVSSDGTRMWKYYLEVTTENHSVNIAKPRYKKLKMIAVVKEINPKSNYKGVAITSIDIK